MFLSMTESMRAAESRFGVPRPAALVDVDDTLVDSYGFPIKQGIEFARSRYAAGFTIVIVTARYECWREETTQWLRKHLPVPFEGPFHRRDGDDRAADIIKAEIYQQIRQRFRVLAAIDDLAINLTMWRRLGIPEVVAVKRSGDGWLYTTNGTYWGRYGAAGLLLHAQGHVLMQHRTNGHHPNTWGLPGGAIDSHETPQAAAMREAMEETGIDAGRITICDRMVTHEDEGWCYTVIMATADELLPTIPNSEGECRWVPVDDVAALKLHPDLETSWPDLLTMLEHHVSIQQVGV